MKLVFGKDKFSPYNEVIWDDQKVMNGHMMLVGGSGTGKTYTIRKIISEISKQNPNAVFHIIDIHGDIDVEGAETVEFAENSQNGIPLLEISPDIQYGGVRKKIRNIISTINRTSRQIGTKQEATFINILTDLYAANGLYTNQPSSWTNYKRMPNVVDLRRFMEYKYKQMLLGSTSECLNALEDLNKSFQSLDKKIKKNYNVTKEDKEDLTKQKQKCKDIFNKFIETAETGKELDDFIKYDNKDVVKSLLDRVTSLESTGLFKSSFHVFKKNIRRYDVKTLNKDEQKMFVDLLLEKIFFEAKKRGEKRDGSIDTYIILDEAHNFITEEAEHIVNIISKEARKFGISQILASQTFTHFNEDIIANSSTKIILGIDAMFHEGCARKLNIDKKRFNYIIPHKSLMIQIKNKGDLSNRFYDVMI